MNDPEKSAGPVYPLPPPTNWARVATWWNEPAYIVASKATGKYMRTESQHRFRWAAIRRLFKNARKRWNPQWVLIHRRPFHVDGDQVLIELETRLMPPPRRP